MLGLMMLLLLKRFTVLGACLLLIKPSNRVVVLGVPLDSTTTSTTPIQRETPLMRIPDEIIIIKRNNTPTMYSIIESSSKTMKTMKRKLRRSRAMLRTSSRKISNATKTVVDNLKQRLLPKFYNYELNLTEIVDRNIEPLLVFVNRKSGGHRGQLVLHKFQSILSECQICDLTSDKPKSYLELFKHIPSERLRILCCGGDGSIQWVMNEVYDAGMHNATFSILPLGTGNDLYLHAYGRNSSSIVQRFLEQPQAFLDEFMTNDAMVMDRWGLTFRKLNVPHTTMSNITSLPRRSILTNALHWRKKKGGVLRTMNNYFGIGVDGAISMKFHSARNTMPFFFFSSIINKFWYACVSLGTIFSGKQFDLNKFLEIKCDGKKVDIPSNLQGVVFLNINSYAGGSKLWMPKDLSTWRSLDMSDGLVEVVGVLGVGHLGQIKAGVSSGIELAQGRRIQIRTKEFIPMQIDGEPWLQRPCKIDFRLLTRVKISKPQFHRGPEIDSSIEDQLEWNREDYETSVLTDEFTDFLVFD